MSSSKVGSRMVENMELDIWHSDWGLPTVEPKCLAALVYCKFSGVPIKVKKTGNPWKSPSDYDYLTNLKNKANRSHFVFSYHSAGEIIRELPLLRHNQTLQSTVDNIFSYLRQQNWGNDYELTTVQSADIVAFCSLLEEKLLPAILHMWWVDEKTYISITRPGYAKASPFPLNFFLPQRMKKKAVLRIYSKGGENVTDIEVDAKIYKEAKTCLNLLSQKLGEQPFFFGERPTSLDALVFGYLAPIMRAPLQDNQLKMHLNGCPNLSRFCSEILQKFFPKDLEEYERKREKEESRKKKNGYDEEFPNKKTNMILAAIFAITTMIGYAFTIGLIKVEVTDAEGEAREESSKMTHDFEPFEPFFEEKDED